MDWNELYLNGRDYTAINELLLDKILDASKLPVNSNALDIGCGTGDLALKLAQRGLQVTGVDLSDVAITKARERAQFAQLPNEIDFRVLNIEDQDNLSTLSDFTYELITIKLVYAFIKNKPEFLKWVKKHLSEDGVFVLITPVLHPKQAYTPRMKNISTPIGEIQNEISIFRHAELLHNDYFEENGDLHTYLLKP